MKKKFSALLISICLILSLIPADMALAASDAGETSGEKCTISFIYQYEDGTTAADSDIISVSAGESLNQAVIMPTVAGYTPYLNEKICRQIQLTGPVQGDRTYTVVYKPEMSLLASPKLLGASNYDKNSIPGRVRIWVNVLDWDSGKAGSRVPVPGVEVWVNRITGPYAAEPDCPHIMKATSNENGVAYADYAIDTSGSTSWRQLAYLNGELIYNSFYNSSDLRFDLAPVEENGIKFITTESGLIRNYVSGQNVGSVEKFAGSAKYNDFYFTGGLCGSGAFIEFDLYVKTDKLTLSFDTSTVSNADQFPSQTVEKGQKFTAPTVTPEHKTAPIKEFLGWYDESGNLFDFSKVPLTSVKLTPKWGPNPNARGYIHLDSYLWNHDAYNENKYGSGWTNTTVNDLTYIVEYYDFALSGSEAWRFLATMDVDANGKGELELSAKQLAELSAFRDIVEARGGEHYVAIDISASKDDRGWHEENQRPLQYAWDWITTTAGLVGVRTMKANNDPNPVYDGNRDNNTWWDGGKGSSTDMKVVGNVVFSSNQNHTPKLTQGMLDDGFEIWWNCYVTPSMTVTFDLDGGAITDGDTSEQKIEPINSIPDQRYKFLAKNPGGTVTKSGMNFVGWYKVKADGTLETTPWDFANRIVTESMVLRAVYTDKLYEVQFVTSENGTQDNYHKVGDTPAWAGADPVKSPSNGYAYEFIGWKETTGTHVNTEYTFHDTYDFDHQSRTIFKGGASTPETIDSTFANLTVYTAQFNARPIDYTLSYDLNGGSGTFADQSYTVETGVTIHNSEPTKIGYKFTGWALKTTDGNWTNKSYSKNETVSDKYGNTTLIAQYAPRYNYKLNFNENTTDLVSNMPENIPETDWIEDSNKKMEWGTEPERTDYTFLGWAESADGEVVVPAGTKDYIITGTPAALAEKTLYAVWQINERSYTVKYLEEVTGNDLHAEKSDVAKVGEIVTEYAETITGYELVSQDPQTKVISADETQNVIIFYYKEEQVEIKYIPVPANGGNVSVGSESVKVLNGNPTGSTASAEPGYKFVGWFSDATCNVKISDNETYIPSKNATSGMYEAATYYAKFEEKLGNLTINKSGCNSADANQSFIFHVGSTNLENTSHEAVDMYVTIQGNGSVTITDLPIGSYEVKEVSSWSWRYTPDGAKNVTVDMDGESTTIANTRTNSSWLSGSAYAINTADGKKSK